MSVNSPEGLSAAERNRLCDECLMAVQAKKNLPGFKFIFNAITLNIPAAAANWAEMIFQGAGDREHCLAFLTKEEAAERRTQWAQDAEARKLDPDPKYT